MAGQGSARPDNDEADRVPYPAAVRSILAVAAGGAAGSVLRYVVSDPLNRRASPWGTVLVNVLGSFLIGVVVGWYSERSADSLVRVFLGVGVLGGFTTFSTWTVETLALLDAGRPVAGLANAVIPLVSGLAAAAAGIALGRAT